MNYDYKDLLVFKSPKSKKNTIVVHVTWDSNDADYIEKTFEMDPEELFNNKKLIYVCAYISLPHDFKNKKHEWNKPAFSHYVPENTDIDDLRDFVCEYDLMAYCEWGDCHSCEGIEMTYYDEDCKPHIISFENIIEEFKSMSYKEICETINSLE